MTDRMVRVALVAALLGQAGLAPVPAAAVGPTDIVHVDDFIGAPRALFGRTRAQVERALGVPPAEERSAVESYRDAAVFRPAHRLAYPDLLIDILDTDRVRRVRVRRPGFGFPLGLDIGSAREEVERVLGEAQEAGDGHLVYVYSDGYPDTVHFRFRDGRVHLIEWNYGSAE